MDTASLLTSLLSQKAVNSVSTNVGATDDQVSAVLASVLPELLNGATKQATDEKTSASFLEALTQHAGNAKSTSENDIAKLIGGADLVDGSKIVKHLLGGNTNSVVNSAAKASGLSEDITGKVLSSVAPSLMTLLGKQTAEEQKKDAGIDVAKLMKGIAAAAAISTVAKNVKGGSKKTSAKSKKGVDLSDGLDVGDVLKIAGKLMK